jgi:superfamily II RNA helicase
MSSSPFLVTPDVSKTPEQLPSHPYSFPLDPFQQHAVCAIAANENVMVCAKTGSGKTLVGEYQIYHSLSKGKRVFYTTPIKSLSNQKFYDLKHQFSNATVGIMTGDIKFCPDAQIVIMTTEILRNLLYKKGTTTEHLGLTASISTEDLDAVIFDECHYINDKDRGNIWEETMILLPPHIQLVLLSATLDHPEYLAEWLGNLKQKRIHLIETQYRIVPLTHYLLGPNEKFITLMDAKEVYYEKAYKEWLQQQHRLDAEQRAYQRAVVDARDAGQQGAVAGKVHNAHFLHRLQETIALLEKKELLPALFFVLSRKQCEVYAKKVERSLLTSSDTAAVKHIITFHLHRHMKELEQVPQYHQIYDLLCRGIAFHHSGLLPLLKEIVEILFTKGYVKIMFCTETFAVGLNMPTKTVVFTGFKKYDDATDSMRILRNDEYIQMAGRAGRRGKDDKGVVIYLPDREPIEPNEMYAMMKGARPPVQSRMTFHYDFILKTIQASTKEHPLTWLRIMEQSYWFRQRQVEKEECQKSLESITKEMATMELMEPYKSDCEKRFQLEQQISVTVNAERKKVQRELDTLKNKQLGPKWNKAWTDYHALKKLQVARVALEEELHTIEQHQAQITVAVQFLHDAGFVTTPNAMELTQESLTLKGLLATEVNEGQAIMMTELYVLNRLHHLSGNEIVTILASFQEKKENEYAPPIQELHVSADVQEALHYIESMSSYYQNKEQSFGLQGMNHYWTMSTQWVEPIQRWMEGEHASVICKEYEIFEGNFIRAVMKMANMMDEWLSMAVYCQHVDQVEKITEVRTRIIRDLIVSDSLYLRL